MLTIIPFSGFYESEHDKELDWALENLFQNDSGDTDWDRHNKAYDLIDWTGVWVKYATEYAEAFAEKYELKTLKFESLQSPKEYNFTTDRIFCEVDEAEVRRVFEGIDKEAFAAQARHNFTSRDGFISYYDPDWTTWGPIEQWDHNQVGTLITTLAMAEGLDEMGLMESARCNGRYDNWLIECGPGINELLEQPDEE